MRGRGGGVRSAVGAAVVALALVAALGAGSALALDSDLKHSYAFKFPASNGYEALAIAASQRADGQGQLVLYLGRKGSGAQYVVAATVTATRIEADLGALGSVALDVLPSGRKQVLHPSCPAEDGERRPPYKIEPPAYQGRIEFHGEEGFTEATATAPSDYSRLFVDLLCAGPGIGEDSGQGLPGARLRLGLRAGTSTVSLQANKNRPGARVHFEVLSDEKQADVRITRTVSGWAPSGAFSYDPALRDAVLEPPAPFAGHASFHRRRGGGATWNGNLSVDLPGRADVPLTGAGAKVGLEPACRREGPGRFRC